MEDSGSNAKHESMYNPGVVDYTLPYRKNTRGNAIELEDFTHLLVV
jgi:hypothetical protein